MEATCDNNRSMVKYDPDTEIYSGAFNVAVLNKFINEGVFEVVDSDADGIQLLMNHRDDFLSGFASGVKEAK
tara:strand:- start:174186 stop:174401 length:216 start_codon:yes stop_codon:yes gene_type:complete